MAAEKRAKQDPKKDKVKKKKKSDDQDDLQLEDVLSLGGSKVSG